ncbi:MAG: hypothetical protein MRERV_22c021 [Mycoplasmataceae bacterium RV_VA103A]|nr:MAG: hypothetical protein MRERV_22c021 [Mycoplasmataceae bacterium RV_VA103A]
MAEVGQKCWLWLLKSKIFYMVKYTKIELAQEIERLKQQLQERERENKFEQVIGLFVEYFCPWLVLSF